MAGRRQPPAPDATYEEGGPYAEVAAALGGPLGVAAGAEGGAVLGRRIDPGGRVTWYDRFDGETPGPARPRARRARAP